MKIHLLISPEPPRYGMTLKAMCGTEVPGAQPVRLDEYDIPRKTLLHCRKCQEVLTKQFRYVSFVTSGEESKQMEGE